MRKSKSIFRKIFEPVLAILILLLGLYTMIIRQNVLVYLKENSLEVLRDHTADCRDYMEGKMLGQWSSINDHVRAVTDHAEAIVARQGKTLTDIETDYELNQKILGDLTEELIEILKTGENTEIFLILDGEATPQKEPDRAGIYIRNSAPDVYNESNSSLVFERGVPAISKAHQISLDIFWKAAFQLKEEESDYFYRPLEAARENENRNFENYGYWTVGRPIDENDKSILTYSVPLIGRDGTVFGVMGIGLDENYYIKNIQNSNETYGRSRAYLLARTADGEFYEPVLMKGKIYNKNGFVGQKLQLEQKKDEPIPYLSNVDSEDRLYASWQKFDLYNVNTPFENEQWGILCVQNEKELLYSYQRAQMILFFMLAGGAAVCLVCIFWFSRFLSKPMLGMVQELRQSNPNRPIRLTKVKVAEIDELARSVEELSTKVARANSRISTILHMTDVGIGVFEYKEKENQLFCSRELYEMLEWDIRGYSDDYVDGSQFQKKMEKWLLRDKNHSEQIMEITMSDGMPRFIKLTQIREEGVILGVLTDITADILEKQKIEMERDYDLLTGLLNRRAFNDRMDALFNEPWQLKNAVMMVWDLDNLKYVNDIYGHSTGDAYIASFGNKLCKMNSRQIFSARRSGDEFITFAYGYEEEEQLQMVADEIWKRATTAEITLPDGRSYRVRVSMGKAWYPRDAADYPDMFEYADFAMYMVKHSHKGTTADFDKQSYKKNRILLQGQEAFNNLLENRLVRYMLQPIVRVEDGHIYGYEMLMRSDMPAFQTPMEILRMAHSQSRLYEVEVMTWFEAMKTYVSKIEEGVCSRDSKVFINSISNQIINGEMIELFEEYFSEYLQNIVCEFTEEEENSRQITQHKMKVLKKWKAMCAIDDYGCGYNSESILLALSPEIVKIDMDIVQGIDKDQNRQQLVTNLVTYAQDREILVLAEGVETREEMVTLMRLGVQFLQGYYVARPAYDGLSLTEEKQREIGECYHSLHAADKG